MTRRPFDSDELGRVDPELDRVAERLERYAAEARAEPPLGLTGRIRSAVGGEPHPRGRFGALFARGSGPARAMAAGAVVALVVAGAIALGQLVELTRQQVGATPSPSVIPTPTATPTPTPTPTPSPAPTDSPTPSPTSTPAMTAEPTLPEGFETETPGPTESDGSGNSGPGGGDGSGNSGPGGGDGSGNSGSGGGSEP